MTNDKLRHKLPALPANERGYDSEKPLAIEYDSSFMEPSKFMSQKNLSHGGMNLMKESQDESGGW